MILTFSMTTKFGFFFLCFILLLTASSNVSAQWVQTSGPYGGDVVSFAGIGANLFAEANGSGAFRSSDGGESWMRDTATPGFNAMARIGSDLFIGSNGGGVYRSTDSGRSWAHADSDLGNNDVTALAVSGTTLFAGTSAGIYFSTDSGMSWMATGSEINVVGLSINAMAVSGSNLFVGTYYGVFLTTNNGASWDSVNTGLPEDRGYYDIDAFTAIGTNLFITTYEEGVFLSTNNGTSWSAVNAGLPCTIDTLHHDTSYDIIEAFAVSGSNLFAATYEGGVFLSTNNGTSWTAVNAGLTNLDVTTLSVFGANGSLVKLLAGTYGGVYLSTNSGASWSAVGLPISDVTALAFGDTNTSTPVLFGGNVNNGVSVSTNNGASWNTASSSISSTKVNAIVANGANIFAGTSDGVFLSTDEGVSWTTLKNGLTSPDVFALAEIGGNTPSPLLFAGTLGGVFLSTNNGTNWSAIQSGVARSYIQALAVTGANTASPMVFAGSYTDGVILSTNVGASWTAVGLGDIAFGNVTSLALSKENTSSPIVFAGTNGGGVYFSTNNGTTWTADTSGLTDDTILALAATTDSSGNTDLFAATDIGIFFSAVDGTNWIPVNTGLTDTDITSLVINGNVLYAGTNNAGVWRRPLSEMVSPYALSTPSSSLAFGNVVVEKDSTLTLTIENTGTAADTISSIQFVPSGGAFTIDTGVLPAIVQPGDSVSFAVTFKPTALGAQFDALVVVSDAKELDISLSGVGTVSAGVSVSSLSAVTLQTYPNPFSESTAIQLTTLEQETVQVSVVNLLGQQVAQLFEGEMEAGEHSYTWDAKNAPDGTYFCIIRANDRFERTAMLLSR
jgi:ligand-binding sensor domain-containing protein